MTNDNHYDPLYVSQMLETYMSSPAPKGGRNLRDEDDDVDISLHLEAEYLAGMVDTFLEGAEWRFDSINLNSSLDESLAKYTPISDKDSDVLEDFKSYRRKMIEVANILSAVTGTPIQWK